MVNLNLLLHGDLEVNVMPILDDTELTNSELRAVLQNLVGAVVRLRGQVKELKAEIKPCRL